MSSNQLHSQAYKLLLKKQRPITGWYHLGGSFFIKSGQIIDTVQSTSVADTVPFYSLFERNKVLTHG